MKRVVETEDAFYIFLFIPNTLSEKFHYKLLSGPCQSLASAPSNSKQRHLDLNLEHRDILRVTILTCDHSVWLWWLSLPPTSLISLHSEAGPQPRLKTQPQSGLVTGSLHYLLFMFAEY